MRGAMDWRVLKRVKIKNEVFRLNVSADNIEVTKMTNAGGNKFDDSLKSPLQLTIIVEDAINRNSFTNKLFFIINTLQFTHWDQI